MRELEPEIEIDRIVKVNAEWQESDIVDQDNFVRAALKHNVKGFGYGVFHIPELDNARDDRALHDDTFTVTGGKDRRVSVQIESSKASGKTLKK